MHTSIFLTAVIFAEQRLDEGNPTPQDWLNRLSSAFDKRISLRLSPLGVVLTVNLAIHAQWTLGVRRVLPIPVGIQPLALSFGVAVRVRLQARFLARHLTCWKANGERSHARELIRDASRPLLRPCQGDDDRQGVMR